MQMFRKTATLALLSAVITASVVIVHAASRSGLDVVHSFAGGNSDGASSAAALIQASDGNFYGTTFEGGAFNKGTVFKMAATGALTVLHTFTGGADGSTPFSAVIQASDGGFYGTTYSGGAAGLGTIFRISADGATFTTLYSFAGGAASGAHPRAAVMQAIDGSLYGTTELGGTADRGTLFRLTGTTVTLLYTFTGGLDGAYPYAPLIQATDGSLYGTTYSGDFSTFGRVFKMTPAGVVTVVHTFASTSGADGANPQSALIQATDGNFYGTTALGGTVNQGTVFKMNAAGDVTVLFSFAGGVEGSTPSAALLQAPDGALYGTAKTGAAGYGTIFKITGAGVFTVVHRFTGGGDGAVSYAPLIRATTGKLYGTAGFGGASSLGVVFRLPLTIPGDFEGDGKSDVAVFRPSTGVWYVVNSSTGAPSGTTWGNVNDRLVTGDYDGDGKSDVAVFRPSDGGWYIVRSSTGIPYGTAWGNGNDVPVPGDYDGDAKTDLAVFRPSNGGWYVVPSSTGIPTGTLWGGGSDIPVPGDYDGDGKTDLAVFRPSTGGWYVVPSSTGVPTGTSWGGTGDIPVPGDYDGDAKTDIAVFRPSNGTWFIINSRTGTLAGYNWGNGADITVPGDYDGDNRTDIAVYRPSAGFWFILKSSTNFTTSTAINWGGSNDIPIKR